MSPGPVTGLLLVFKGECGVSRNIREAKAELSNC